MCHAQPGATGNTISGSFMSISSILPTTLYSEYGRDAGHQPALTWTLPPPTFGFFRPKTGRASCQKVLFPLLRVQRCIRTYWNSLWFFFLFVPTSFTLLSLREVVVIINHTSLPYGFWKILCSVLQLSSYYVKTKLWEFCEFLLLYITPIFQDYQPAMD